MRYVGKSMLGVGQLLAIPQGDYCRFLRNLRMPRQSPIEQARRWWKRKTKKRGRSSLRNSYLRGPISGSGTCSAPRRARHGRRGKTRVDTDNPAPIGPASDLHCELDVPAGDPLGRLSLTREAVLERDRYGVHRGKSQASGRYRRVGVHPPREPELRDVCALKSPPPRFRTRAISRATVSATVVKRCAD